MQKRVKKKFIFGLSIMQVYLLVSMSFAFAFLLGQEIGRVDAQTANPIKSPSTSTSDTLMSTGPSLLGMVSQFTRENLDIRAGAISNAQYDTALSSSTKVTSNFGTVSGASQTTAKTFDVLKSGAATIVNPKQALSGFADKISWQPGYGVDDVASATMEGNQFVARNNFGTVIGTTPASNLPVAGSGTSSATATSYLRPLSETTKLGTFGNAMISGVFYGAMIGGIAYMIGGMAGLSKKNQQVLFLSGLALGVGYQAGQWLVSSYGSYSGFAGGGAAGTTLARSSATQTLGGFSGEAMGAIVGIAAAALIFIMMYSSEKVQKSTFTCLPWEPPLGGQKCADCNKDPLVPCSEYRCKSLGQACELLNKGTTNEQCVWVSKNDVNSAKITPWTTPLNAGLAYGTLATRPISRGTKIVNSANKNGCLAPYTQLSFGIATNEPAQCKLDYKQTNFSNMQFYFGGSNYFEYNHSQTMLLPSPNDQSVAPVFQNDGTFQLWIQCQDANGNINQDSYLVEYCVDKSPDTTAPVISGSSIDSGNAVPYQIDHLLLDVYTNELATCKWSRKDQNYNTMENNMVCMNSTTDLNFEPVFACTGNLTGIKDRENNDFYFRCQDRSGNQNTESKKITLRGSQPLNIISLTPNETQVGSTSTIPVEVQVITDDGADEGKAACSYSNYLTTGFIEMAETGDFTHKQTLDLNAGNYTYAIKCSDSGGNLAYGNLSFNVFIDGYAPQVTRVYKDEVLKIVTNEDATCSYSKNDCNFETGKGIAMEYANTDKKNLLYAPWVVGQTYYIKCEDKYGNQPLPNDCSVIVKPRPLSAETTSTGTTTGTIGTVTS